MTDFELETEQIVLFLPLLEPKYIDLFVRHTREEFFSTEHHRIIYRTMLSLIESGQVVNPDTLIGALLKNGELEDVGGENYIYTGLDFPRSIDYEHRVKQLADFYLKRRLEELLQQKLEQLVEQQFPTDTILQQLIQELNELQISRQDTGLRKIRDILTEFWGHLEKISEQTGGLTGLSTGYAHLDQLTSGFQKGDLIIIAGRPSMGKTSFALNLAIHAAQAHHKVAFFSLEMSSFQLIQRILAILTGIELTTIRTGQLSKRHWAIIGETVSQLAQMNMYIDDSAGLKIHDIKSLSRTLQQQDGLDIIFVDYLQLLRSGRRYESRQQEVTYISQQLKELAKELDVPVVALSQLSRNPDRREDSRPQLSDLRESGAIEQDADVVMFIYREEVYHPEKAIENLAEIIIAKQRNGPTETVKFYFDKKCQKFRKIDEQSLTLVPF